MTSPAALPSASEPTHGCVRCGRPVPIHVALCEECNPLGLRQPAATQVHALAAGGIVLFVVILAVLAGFGLSGVGPFSGTVMNVEAAAGGLAVTIEVSNEGSRGAATTCRVIDIDRAVGGPSQIVQTPSVAGGKRLTFTVTVTAFGEQPHALAIDCQSP